jgi:hypothetical protein
VPDDAVAATVDEHSHVPDVPDEPDALVRALFEAFNGDLEELDEQQVRAELVNGRWAR